jgi:SAM-dependent methyltransferase
MNQDFRNYREQLLESENLTLSAHDYEAYHSKRFNYVFKLVTSIQPDQSAMLLDVGRSSLSAKFADYYKVVHTLGFPLSETEKFGHEAGSTRGSEKFGGHITFDLNVVPESNYDDNSVLFDIIVCAEVLEHLHAAPEITLKALSYFLRPGGHMIVQTPNAAALHKRLLSMLGKNPYERIRIDTRNPGHFREYTGAELLELAGIIGLDVIKHDYVDYFAVSGGVLRRISQRLLKVVAFLVPAMARGQTIVLHKSLQPVKTKRGTQR